MRISGILYFVLLRLRFSCRLQVAQCLSEFDSTSKKKQSDAEWNERVASVLDKFLIESMNFQNRIGAAYLRNRILVVMAVRSFRLKKIFRFDSTNPARGQNCNPSLPRLAEATVYKLSAFSANWCAPPWRITLVNSVFEWIFFFEWGRFNCFFFFRWDAWWLQLRSRRPSRLTCRVRIGSSGSKGSSGRSELAPSLPSSRCRATTKMSSTRTSSRFRGIPCLGRRWGKTWSF